MRGRGSVAFCCVLFLMTALVVAVPVRLEPGSNGFHYRHGNGSSGAAVPGATVTATSQERGQTYAARRTTPVFIGSPNSP